MNLNLFYLEAVAHDVFANGYTEAQRGALKTQVKSAGIEFKHWEGYDNQSEVTKVFQILNELVNTRMKTHFASTTCIGGGELHFTPQLWRTFESEVHLVPPLLGNIALAGVFRQDSQDTFHPFIA